MIKQLPLQLLYIEDIVICVLLCFMLCLAMVLPFGYVFPSNKIITGFANCCCSSLVNIPGLGIDDGRSIVFGLMLLQVVHRITKVL